MRVTVQNTLPNLSLPGVNESMPVTALILGLTANMPSIAKVQSTVKASASDGCEPGVMLVAQAGWLLHYLRRL
jgi:hypothetical protein